MACNIFTLFFVTLLFAFIVPFSGARACAIALIHI